MSKLLDLAIIAGCAYAATKNKDGWLFGDPEAEERRKLEEEKRQEEEKNIQVVHIHHHY